MNDRHGGFAGRLRDLIAGHRSLRRVAGDPALTAELLLIVRMSFADGKVGPAEAEALRSVATRALGLDGDELGEILRYIEDFGYETTSDQAAAILAELPETRRREIMEHLASVARADGDVDGQERALFNRTAHLLGLK